MDNANVIDSTAVPVTNLGLASVMKIPAVRQIMLLVGVAGAVAAGLAVFLWSQAPTYMPIYTGGNSTEASEVAGALRAGGFDHKYSPTDGSVLVDGSRFMEAQMHLGGQGIDAVGGQPSILDTDFGTSNAVEQELLRQELERNIARTISKMSGIRGAEVHLAMPIRSSFIRTQEETTASVHVTTFSGRMLDGSQSAAIIQMVATAVPYLSKSNVTLTDQHGRLLSSGDDMDQQAMAAAQLDYQQTLEQKYVRNLEQIITPLVGLGKVRAQVSADIDFSQREVASENYDGANAAVVSRQINETSMGGADAVAAGTPGALTNQPPATGGEVPTEAQQVATRNTTSSSTENFEIPRTVTYEKPEWGAINRLSVAILVDATPAEGADEAAASATSLTQAEIDRIESIAREVIGFDATRGDSVVVTSAVFRDRVDIEPVEMPPIWENPVVRDIAKQVLGVAVVLAIVFGVVRPMLKNVVASHAEGQALTAAYPAAPGMPQTTVAIPPPSFDEKVAAARNISGNDPARVAQVVKQWVGDNG